VDAPVSGGGAKPKTASSRNEREASSRAMFRRRRAITLTAALLILALAWIAYCEWGSGRLALYQQSDAGAITKGFSFGPFYAPAKRNCRFAYSVHVPAAAGMWETRLDIQNSHGVTIYPQSDLILAGRNSFSPTAKFSRSCRFVLRDAGFYYLKFTQVNGAYGSTPGFSANSAAPVMTMWVRTGVVGGMEEWLPIILVLGLILLLWFLI
jgi:hypothetical protein